MVKLRLREVIMTKCVGLGSQNSSAQIPVLELTRIFNFSMPQSPHLKNVVNYSNHITIVSRLSLFVYFCSMSSTYMEFFMLSSQPPQEWLLISLFCR